MSKLISLIVIFHIAQFYGNDATITTQQKNLNFPGQDLIFDYESYQDGKLTYATCDKNNTNTARKCKVVREKTPHSDDFYTCDITIKQNENVINDIGLIPFGKEMAVFYQAESGRHINIKFNIINFNGCKVIETEVPITNPVIDPRYATIITPYDDSFDVFFKNFTMCGRKGYCKVTIDVNGKIIDGPTAVTQSPILRAFMPYINAVDPQSRDKGIFFMEHVNGSLSWYNLVVDKLNGSKTSLGVHKAYLPITKTTSNNFVSVCYKENERQANLRCLQYDDDGNLKFEMDPVIGYNKTDVVFPHNLPNGGLLLLAGKCDKRYCEVKDVQFLVIKVDSTGKRVGTLAIGTLAFISGTGDSKLVPSFYVNADSNYCLSIVNYRCSGSGHADQGKLKTSSYCFTDQDFSE